MKRLVTALAALLVAAPLFAHHGKDFLVVESYEVPHTRNVYGVTSEQLLFADSNLAFREELSVLSGLTHRLAAEVHVHIEKAPGESAQLEAIAPALHVHLFDRGPNHGAVSAEYEIGRHGAGNSPTVRFIVGREIGEGAVVANLGARRSHEEGTNGIYAIGYRSDLESPRGWGIEAQGELHRNVEHEILGAAYLQPSNRLTLKIGAGAIVGNGTPAKVVRSGFVWQF
jgi:hypothetical protein